MGRINSLRDALRISGGGDLLLGDGGASNLKKLK